MDVQDLLKVFLGRWGFKTEMMIKDKQQQSFALTSGRWQFDRLNRVESEPVSADGSLWLDKNSQ